MNASELTESASRPKCEGCGHEIDPDYCGCGDRIDHSPWAGHAPIPMGCVCGYDPPLSDEQQVKP